MNVAVRPVWALRAVGGSGGRRCLAWAEAGIAKGRQVGSFAAVDLKWRISHVRGYLELGMAKEAKAELDAIPEAEARRPEVVALRVGMLQATASWRELRKYARALVEADPNEAGWWIIWAYAARRAATVKAAEKILQEAAERHPQDATIQFNLGCYACLLGDLGAAKARLIRAITIDSSFLKNAMEDPDLQALRDQEPDWINSEGGDARQEG